MDLAPTATPRVDRFIAEHPLRLPEHLKNDVSAVLPLRQFMIDWAEFARDLERELNQSVPKEWAEPAASCTICGRPTALGQCLRADCGEPFANGPDTKF